MESSEKVQAKDKESPSERSFNIFARSVLWGALATALVLIIIYTITFWNTPIDDKEYFAQFGDFLGGTLNPILTFGTIVLLVFSIRFQLDELRLTRLELKNQLIEQQENNQIQLRIAEINERTLNLPALMERVSSRHDEINHFNEQEYAYKYVILNDQRTLSVYSLTYKSKDYRQGTLEEILQNHINDNDSHIISLDESIKSKFVRFLTDAKFVKELLDDYVNNGGSAYLAHELAIKYSTLFFALTDSDDSKIVNSARSRLGEFHSFTSRYYQSKDEAE